MMINEEFKKVKACIGEKLTPAWNTYYKKSLPKKLIQTMDDSAIEEYRIPENLSTHPTNMAQVLESFLTNDNYSKACALKASDWNLKNPTKERKVKEFAKALFASPDNRRAKSDLYLDDNFELQQRVTNDSYTNWTGLQCFDIDFVDDILTLEESFDKSKEAQDLKPILYEQLKDYPWFMWVTMSTGGHGVHIYTATDVPILYNTDQKVLLFESLYQKKALTIYKVLYDTYGDRLPLDIIMKLLDPAMYKPEQPMYLTVYDSNPLVNENFKFIEPSEEIEALVKQNKHYIYRDNDGVMFPKKDSSKYRILYDYYWENKTFTKPLAFNYDYKTENKLNIMPNDGSFDSNLDQLKWKHDKFYFGYKEHHDGVPTLWEICKYLLSTRGYDRAKVIINSGIYKKPDVDEISCTMLINRILDAIHNNKWNCKTPMWVQRWVNDNLGFEDVVQKEKITQDRFAIEPYMVKDDKDKVMSIQANYDTYFKMCPTFAGKFKFDDFNKIKEYDGKPFYDELESSIRNKIRLDFPTLSNDKIIKDEIAELCYTNKYNPLQEKIKSLVWDGTKRAETLFIDFLKVDDLSITREITRKILIAAVLRCFNPGSQVDIVLILYGAQGIGKTVFLRRMGFGKYTITISLTENGLTKDIVQKMQKGWLINIDEMSGMKRTTLEKLKSDLTETEDNERFAYGTYNGNYPRKCIFVATTNDKACINDFAGVDEDGASRRFCPLECKQTDKEYVYNNLTEYYVEQVWAEVYQWYLKGDYGPLYITDSSFGDYQTQFTTTTTDVAVDWTLDILNQRYMLDENGEIPSLSAFLDNYIHGKDNPNIAINGTQIDKIPLKWVKAVLDATHRISRSESAILKALKGKFYKKMITYNNEEQYCLVRKQN